MWAMVLGGFATFVYADLKRNRESAARLQAATLRRARAARDVLQTRAPGYAGEGRAAVPVRHARPRSARSTTAIVRKGQRTIDDLIVYLRTAMPQMNSS